MIDTHITQRNNDCMKNIKLILSCMITTIKKGDYCVKRVRKRVY